MCQACAIEAPQQLDSSFISAPRHLAHGFPSWSSPAWKLVLADWNAPVLAHVRPLRAHLRHSTPQACCQSPSSYEA